MVSEARKTNSPALKSYFISSNRTEKNFVGGYCIFTVQARGNAPGQRIFSSLAAKTSIGKDCMVSMGQR